jgi:hypothetical protein
MLHELSLQFDSFLASYIHFHDAATAATDFEQVFNTLPF